MFNLLRTHHTVSMAFGGGVYYLFLFVYVGMCVSVHTLMEVSLEDRGTGSPGAGFSSGCGLGWCGGLNENTLRRLID